MYCYIITNCYNKNYNLRLNYWLKVPRRTTRCHEPKYGKEVKDLLEEISMLIISSNQFKKSKQQSNWWKLWLQCVQKKVKKFAAYKVCDQQQGCSGIHPEDERRKGLQDQELRLRNMPTEKALGIHWNMEKDKLGFDVNFKGKPHTKRGMLSMVGSIYDPLGLVSPFVQEGRKIIQIRCCVSINLLGFIQ